MAGKCAWPFRALDVTRCDPSLCLKIGLSSIFAPLGVSNVKGLKILSDELAAQDVQATVCERPKILGTRLLLTRASASAEKEEARRLRKAQQLAK